MHSSATIYSGIVLKLYDLWVLRLSNNYAWQCSTSKVLLPFFTEYIQKSRAHLDVGVGTGFYPSNAVAQLPESGENTKIHLLDMNPTTLDFSATRARKAGFKGVIETLEHDVFQPIPDDLHGQFDTISTFYLFHCLPGAFPNKIADVAKNLLPALTPDGVFYGATILGDSANHNFFGRSLMRFYNSKGVFGNTEDTVEGLKEGLKTHFEDVEVRVVGKVALYVARRPKQAQ
ncbi:hypothetical protein NLI96_g12665 [Meripilus lineatus]|uniref:Methyltransferase type 12 domain-containing protein n=1 Tax=Meripilus lineatus TaxID=2056292 RepID=A0AAD5UPN6_9APHY|nr:hypothetical protein NLI96_g12665 [Physisporinus lineatus]